MNTVDQDLEKQFLRLPNLGHVGMALAQFIHALDNEGSFVKKDTDWIFEPSKFVAFGFPKRGGEQIRMQFRQFYPHYRDKNDEQILKLYDGRFHHFKCLITEPRQLACAAKFLELSFLYPC